MHQPSSESTVKPEAKDDLTPEPENKLPANVRILPLRGLVVFPQTSVPLNVGQPRSVRLIDDADAESAVIGLFASKDPENQSPGPDDIYPVGTLAAVYRLLRQPDGTLRMMVNGLQRIRIRRFVSHEPYLVAEIETDEEAIDQQNYSEAMARNLTDMFLRISEDVPSIPSALIASSLSASDPLKLAYTVATYLHLDLPQAQNFLEMNSLSEKLEWLLHHIGQEIEIMEMGRQIRAEAYGQMDQAQREYFLREQLKAIRRQLGEEDERQIEANDFRYKIENADMPEIALKEALRELNRLTKLPVAAAEYAVVRNHLEWLTTLPWNHITADNLNIDHARKVLDDDHHGLDEIKERIVEYLAVRRLRQQRNMDNLDRDRGDLNVTGSVYDQAGAILCLAGPPGVGKTSLGRSVARAMGRRFTRIALGGMRDEAEIRGHRRTYIGASPGRIIEALRQTGSRNPVIMLDEIDKLGADFRGDPASALLEVLDPEQNQEFRDHYLDVPFDLSGVMFITTANTLDTIPGPLRDRMEVLQLSGYTEREKVAIAQDYLVPRQIAANGLHINEVAFEAGAIRNIIHEYTREAGVRNLERQIGRICRKIATTVAAEEEKASTGLSPVMVDAATLPLYLGPARFVSEIAERTQMPGVATGLAWTASGGNILFVEAAKMPGHKGLTLTGQIGEVMRESAQAALSYIRAQADQLGIAGDFFEGHDLHVHVPAGAIPKDGPSAGVTIAVALASLLCGRSVRPDVGMTGELTLRGQVLAVGGIKEKILAAHRAGLTTVILPQRNEVDLAQLPDEVLQELSLVQVSHIDEALSEALV